MHRSLLTLLAAFLLGLGAIPSALAGGGGGGGGTTSWPVTLGLQPLSSATGTGTFDDPVIWAGATLKATAVRKSLTEANVTVDLAVPNPFWSEQFSLAVEACSWTSLGRQCGEQPVGGCPYNTSCKPSASVRTFSLAKGTPARIRVSVGAKTLNLLTHVTARLHSRWGAQHSFVWLDL